MHEMPYKVQCVSNPLLENIQRFSIIFTVSFFTWSLLRSTLHHDLIEVCRTQSPRHSIHFLSSLRRHRRENKKTFNFKMSLLSMGRTNCYRVSLMGKIYTNNLSINISKSESNGKCTRSKQFWRISDSCAWKYGQSAEWKRTRIMSQEEASRILSDGIYVVQTFIEKMVKKWQENVLLTTS